MSPENGKHLPESDAEVLNLMETELTLGLPGDTRGAIENGAKSGKKRAFSQAIDLNHDRSSGVYEHDDRGCGKLENQTLAVKPPAAKEQIVGWPPVREFRKNAMKSFKFVKVAVDGAPFLRKVDLEMYSSYRQLLCAFDDLFYCLTIRNYLNEKKLIDTANGVEYVPTYEDKDGDWMLVGDVPWKMFVESCKRLRLMKSSEAIGLGPRTPQQSACTS